jgi:hypothetical protein
MEAWGDGDVMRAASCSNAIHYLNPGPNGAPFEVVSYGADNQVGGDGENQDISSAGPSGAH